jgi:hypothetical protein
LKTTDVKIRKAAIESLQLFPKIGTRSTHIFSREKVLRELKHIYHENLSHEMRVKVLTAIARLSPDPAGFLLDVLHSGEDEMKIETLELIAGTKDPSAGDFIRPYLGSEKPFIKATAASLLEGHKVFGADAKKAIQEILDPSDQDHTLAICRHLGNVKHPGVTPFLHKSLFHSSGEVRMNAAFALLQKGFHRAAVPLADLLLDGNTLLLDGAKNLVRRLPLTSKRYLMNELQEAVIARSALYGVKDASLLRVLESLDHELLKKLKNVYECFGMDDDAELIDTILEHRGTFSEVPSMAQ